MPDQDYAVHSIICAACRKWRRREAVYGRIGLSKEGVPMRIKADTGKANVASADLLSLSRAVRCLREETEAVRRRLRQSPQLDVCRAELRRQEEELALLTARLVNLSTAMSQIVQAYNRVEKRNLDRLEEDGPRRAPADMVLYSVGLQYQKRLRKILGQ